MQVPSLFAFLLALVLLTPGLVLAGGVDVLVFAPHPDDEVIGCSGVIMDTLEAGETVGVVILTNGDGFPRGAASITGKTPAELTSRDFLKLAALRQRQSLRAALHVGLTGRDLTFLSYPDGGLASMYRSEQGSVFHQPHSGKSQTYGLVVADYHSRRHEQPAPYTKSALLEDLTGIIRRQQPREIYVTNAIDPHPDHQAAFRFVRDAARGAGYQGMLQTFVVHGDEKPPGPARRVSLTATQLESKKAAIGEHAIPGVHDHLVSTHARKEEVFWPVPIQ